MAAGGVMQGAMQGASAGSAFGPWGAAAGAVIGGIAGNQDGGSDANEHAVNLMGINYLHQKEFAQNGVRWRVDDARRAGIHPGLAFGMQPSNFSPISVGGGDKDRSDTSWLAGAGHDITRAIDATRTAPEKMNARMQALSLERGELENEYLRSQIRKINAPAVGPAFPDPWNKTGSGDQPFVSPKAMEPTAVNPDRPFSEPGPVSDVGYLQTNSGYVPSPSKDAKDRIEDNIIQEVQHFLRNNLLPRFAGGARNEPPLSALPAGAYGWRWNPVKMEWQAKFPDSRTNMLGRTIRLAD